MSTETRLSIDRPGDGERPAVRQLVVVEGWAWTPEGDPQLTVTVGGRPAEVVPGPWRPDVSAALGVGALRGYVATVSVADMPPGTLEIVATATGSDGLAVQQRRTVEVTSGSGADIGRPRPWAGFTERLDPKVAPSGLTHAEHVARYRWAAQLAEGREILDAGCGVGFGAHILRDGGAVRVTGVDAFAAAIIEAREQARDSVEFQIGDLRALPFEPGSFDYVVCFEAIEHVSDQEHVLAEIKRVLRPGGLLAMSTPVPGGITVHNPHHVAERTPEELEALLTAAFANVELHWQHSALASLIDVGPANGRPAATSPPLGWTAGPSDPLYVIALASDGDLPRPDPLGALAAGHDIGALVSQAYELLDDLAEARAEASAYRARAERAELANQALEQHKQARELDIQGLEHAMQQERDALEQRLAQTIRDAAVISESRSWKLTEPLRSGAQKLRGWRG